MTRHRWLAGWAVAIGLAAGDADAQSAGATFEELPRLVKAGDKIAVVGTDGRETRGVIETVSPAGLTLRRSVSAFALTAPASKQPPPPPIVFRADDVVKVTRGGDSVWNGTLIGAGIALGLGVAAVATATGDASDGLAALPAAALMGAGAGFLVDWSIGRKQTVWSAGGSGARARAEVVPRIGKGVKGVSLALRF